MGTELTPQKKFEEKVKERLRDNIGDLMPDEILQKLLEQAVQEMFFTRKESRSTFRQEHFPSWFEDEVSKILRKRINIETQNYFEKNQKEMTEIIRTTLINHIPEFLSQSLVQGFTTIGQGIGESLANHIQNEIYNAMNS